MKKTLMSLIAAAGMAVSGCDDEKTKYVAQPQPCANPKNTPLMVTTKADLDYNLLVKGCENETYVSGDTVSPRAGDDLLHFYEAQTNTARPVYPLEWAVLTDANNTEFTHIVRYLGHDPDTRTLFFHDQGTAPTSLPPTEANRQVTYDAAGNAQLIASGVTYNILVDPASGFLAIDQNADGVYDGKQAPIMHKDGTWTLKEDLLK